MPITVMCRGCEKRYQVKDEYAGKKIRCPGCSSVLSVRAQRPKVDEYEDYGEIPEDADDDFGDEPRALPEPRRRRRRQERRAERTRSRTVSRGSVNFGPWILAGVGFAAVAGLIVVCLLFPPVIMALSFLMIFGGLATSLVGGVGCIVRAFQEDPLCGILYLFVPFYGLYFIVTRWSDVQPFGYCLFGGMGIAVLSIFGFTGMMGLSQAAGSGSFANRPASGRAAPQPPGLVGNPPRVNQPPAFPQPGQQFAPQPMPQFPATIPQPDRTPFRPPVPSFPQEDMRDKVTMSEAEAEFRTYPVPASHEFKVKDRVYVQWGSSWYECEVLDVSGGEDPKVHWVGWSSSWDEVIARSRIRIPRKK